MKVAYAIARHQPPRVAHRPGRADAEAEQDPSHIYSRMATPLTYPEVPGQMGVTTAGLAKTERAAGARTMATP